MTPLIVWTVCEWQSFGLMGQWRCTIDHDSRLAGIAPSSASVEPPSKSILSPTAHVRAVVGVVIVGTGAVLLALIVTVLLSDSPPGSVTRSRAT